MDIILTQNVFAHVCKFYIEKYFFTQGSKQQFCVDDFGEWVRRNLLKNEKYFKPCKRYCDSLASSKLL